MSVAPYKDIVRLEMLVLGGGFTEQDVKDVIGGTGHNDDSDDFVSAHLFGDDHDYRDGDFRIFAFNVAEILRDLEIGR